MTLGVYVHLPFCKVRCTYCPFAISTDQSLESAYVDALVREISARATRAPVDSVYFGGGTPSRTSPASIQRVVDAIHASFAVRPDAETTLEANPEDVTTESLTFWSSLGVNRLSLGVQSFHDAELYALGRGHGSKQAIAATREASSVIPRVNLDLILGLPNQTRESFAHSLETALSFGIGHLSLYMLDLEEGTKLKEQADAGRVSIPDDGLVAQMYVDALEMTARSGLRQYEISNFAREGEESQHNLRYWRRVEYLGVGLGAHSFVNERREANTRDMRDYIDRAARGESPVVFREALGDAERKHERIFLALRQAAGIDERELVELCGKEGTEWSRRGLAEGWLQRIDRHLAFTPKGFLLSNDYISQLF